ncbi:cation:proton antiporter [Candidatus Woesearchaeota archaeon]|nr:cation:proton antiporter [Candidatus Woesearchaeota archaeon]
MVFSSDIGLIVLFSILGGVLAVRFRQPSVIGLVLIGSVVGPNNLGIVQDLDIIEVSIEVGAVLLLFAVGIEFSLPHLIKKGVSALATATVKVGIVFLLSYCAAVLLGFDSVVAFYIGIILSITSTVIFVKILEQKGLLSRPENSLLVAVLIIEDIIGVFALTIFSSINSRADLEPFNLLLSFAVSVLVLALFYMVVQRVIGPVISWVIKYSSEETSTFTAIGLCGGMSYLASLLGLSPSVGAFMAGNLVSSVPEAKVFERAIHPFILAFTSLFFFSIGTLVDLSFIAGAVWVVAVLVFVNLVSKFFSVGIGSYVFGGFSGRQAVFSGVAMVSVGEFSLLIAREASNAGLGVDLVSITATVIVASAIIMSVGVNHADRAYTLVKGAVPFGLISGVRGFAAYVKDFVVWGSSHSEDVERFKTDVKLLAGNLFALFVVLVFSVHLWYVSGSFIKGFWADGLMLYSGAALLVVAVALPAFNIFRYSRKAAGGVMQMSKDVHSRHFPDDRRVIWAVCFVALLFLASVLVPVVIMGLHVNVFYNMVVLAPLLLASVLAFKIAALAKRVSGKK